MERYTSILTCIKMYNSMVGTNAIVANGVAKQMMKMVPMTRSKELINIEIVLKNNYDNLK